MRDYLAIILEGADGVQATTGDCEHCEHDPQREYRLRFTG